MNNPINISFLNGINHFMLGSGPPTENLLAYLEDNDGAVVDSVGLSVSDYADVDDAVRDIFFVNESTLRDAANAYALAMASPLLNDGIMIGSTSKGVALYSTSATADILAKAQKYFGTLPGEYYHGLNIYGEYQTWAGLPEANYYVDSNVAASGNGSSPEQAFKTLAEVPALQLGEVVGLAADSVFRESFDAGAQSVVVCGYGSGDHPRITGADVADTSGSVQDDSTTYPNVYRFNTTHDTAEQQTWVGLLVDGDMFLRVMIGTTEEPSVSYATEAECLGYVNSESNTFYYVYTGGEHRYYVNSGSNPSSDGKTYEYKRRTVALEGAEYLSTKYIQLDSTRTRNGVIYDNLYSKRSFTGTVFKHGGIHNLLIGGQYWEQSQSLVSPGISGGGSAFHNNSPTASPVGVAYVECLARSYGGTSFYNHDNVQPFITIIDSMSNVEPDYQSARFFDYTSNAIDPDGKLYVIGSEVNTDHRVLRGSAGSIPSAATYVEDSVFYSSGFSLNNAKTVYVRNCRFLTAATSTAAFTGFGVSEMNVVFDYCTIVLDFRTLTYTPFSNDRLLYFTGSGNITFNNCLFVILGTYGTPPRIGALDNVTLAYNNCQANLADWRTGGKPVVAYDSSDDLHDDPVEAGNWAVTETSPAFENDIGWRAGRAPIYRTTAQLLANTLIYPGAVTMDG